MGHIRSPATPIDHPDRFLACREVIELARREVAHAAVEAGSSEDEVATALVDVADHQMLGRSSTMKTNALLAALNVSSHPKP